MVRKMSQTVLGLQAEGVMKKGVHVVVRIQSAFDRAIRQNPAKSRSASVLCLLLTIAKVAAMGELRSQRSISCL
jgi:hypothetical protein